MTTVNQIINAPTLEQAIAELKASDAAVTRHEVRTSDLELYPDNTVRLGDRVARLPASSEAIAEIGRLVRVPSDYFSDICDGQLRALSFNHLLKHRGPEYKTIIAEIQSETLTKVCPTCLIRCPRIPLLEAVRESVPPSISSANVKLIKHRWNGVIDLSVIAETLTCTPRPGDCVAFGLNVAEDTKGAVQVQAASFRLICKNGAVNRICSGTEQRLRRPMHHTDRSKDFLRQVKAFAVQAWTKWESNANDIMRLPTVPIYEERLAELRAILRNAPFFLPAGLVDQVLNRLHVEAESNRGSPTAFDLWNALTSIGSHNDSLTPLLSYRLRRGAGELAHHSARTCSSCRQILLS